ncbi:MAG: hypothetical protein QGI08_13785 [Paracoccaceae bacterium]|nr:hypothetical protein [Paracoccaceae bacterium]MDP7186790.1 hypothetical protein [Paracoccaceae bacterium]
MKRAVWALTFAAAANYALLFWYGMRVLDGQKQLDLYVLGYSHPQVMAFIAGLEPGMAQKLTTEVRLIDTSFPILLGLALVGWTLIAGKGLGLVRVVAALIPLAYALVDLYENHLIAGILTSALPGVEQVALASAATITKFILIGGSAIILLWFIYRRIRG